MRNKKAQISTSTIIYIAIGVFVLLLVVALVTGVFGWFDTGVKPSEVSTAQKNCKLLCEEAKTNLDTWKSSSYCKDLQNVGDINGDGTDDFVNCWDDPIKTFCGAKSLIGDKYTAYYIDTDLEPMACSTKAGLSSTDADTEIQAIENLM